MIAGASIGMSSNQTIPKNEDTILNTWGEVRYQDVEVWTPAQPSRLTIPTGITHAWITVQVSGFTQQGAVSIELWKNGQSFDGAPCKRGQITLPSQEWRLNLNTFLQVSPGDFFEVVCWNAEVTSILTEVRARADSAFSIQLFRKV